MKKTKKRKKVKSKTIVIPSGSGVDLKDLTEGNMFWAYLTFGLIIIIPTFTYIYATYYKEF